MNHTRNAELRAARFRDEGGTRAEYLEAAADSVRAEVKLRGWGHADEVRELAVHLGVARKVWDTMDETEAQSNV